MAGRHQRHTSRDVLLSVGGGAVAGAQPLGRCFHGAFGTLVIERGEF